MPDQVKWGVLGCAGIAQKVCEAIREASNSTCVAVASRDKAKAEAFIAEHAPGAKAYGSYEELLADDDVQVVYIPLPTGMKAEWVAKAAAKKKHVLCEKPLGNVREARIMIDACNAAGVQFMDNTMFMHHERQAAMRKVLDDTEFFGVPKHIVSSFTLPFGLEADWAKDNIRVKRSTEPLGALGDLGWYCVRFALWAFNYEDPEQVSCHFLEETSEGVPLHCIGTLKFSGGRTATFDCSFKHAIRSSVEIVGEKRVLTLNDFVITNKKDQASFTVYKADFGNKGIDFPIESKVEEIKGCVQHTRLVEKLSEIALKGELEEFWPKVTLQTQLVLGALVASAREAGKGKGKGRTWVTPKEPTGPKGGGKGKGRPGKEFVPAEPIEKVKATFATLSSVNPGSSGLNLQVKVVSVEAVPGATPMCTAVVGDATGVVTLVAKGDSQVSLFQQGASLVLRNASVRMFKGFIRLQVDRWGKIEASSEPFQFTPKESNDISATEYELVQED